MSKYKFNLDPKEPREEIVRKHKDFGKVMQNYQKMTKPLYRTPLYRFRRIFMVVIAVLAVSWLVSEFGDFDRNEKNSPQKPDTMQHKTGNDSPVIRVQPMIRNDSLKDFKK
ncbi:MAG TPA: hypothetical protein VFU15_15330 [Bacteroidia bacterium]|nr:hypothetical protein [Bacteroidia bacterium]